MAASSTAELDGPRTAVEASRDYLVGEGRGEPGWLPTALG